jgi:hypothetical protein
MREGRGKGNYDIKPAFLAENASLLVQGGYWTGPDMEHSTWARARVIVRQKACGGNVRPNSSFIRVRMLFFEGRGWVSSRFIGSILSGLGFLTDKPDW